MEAERRGNGHLLPLQESGAGIPPLMETRGMGTSLPPLDGMKGKGVEGGCEGKEETPLSPCLQASPRHNHHSEMECPSSHSLRSCVLSAGDRCVCRVERGTRLL